MPRKAENTKWFQENQRLRDNEEHPLHSILTFHGYTLGQTNRSYSDMYHTYTKPAEDSVQSHTTKTFSAVPDSVGHHAPMTSTSFRKKKQNHTIEVHTDPTNTKWYYHKPGKTPHVDSGGRLGFNAAELERHLKRVHKDA
jgi:hypothetical protein